MNSNKTLSLLLIIIALCQTSYSQSSMGMVKEGLVIESKILKKTLQYSIYLPADYEASNRYYPITYLLHGYSDDHMGWIQFGEVHLIADEAIEKRELAPMIIVMPDGGVSWYINNYDKSLRYEDFFFDEFIPFIESKYRIRTEKQYRGIAGQSMGGYGALVYSFKHPEMFSSCAAFSSALYTKEEMINMDDAKWETRHGILYGSNLKGEDRITEHYIANNPLYMLQNSDLKEIGTLRIFIDCGDDDHLYKGNSTFHMLLRDLNISHEYRVRDGGHQWSYWREGLLEGLKFIGTSFHKQ